MGLAFISLALTADAPPQEIFPKAEEASLTALRIDDTFAEAHTNLGWIYFLNHWDWRGAENEFLRSLNLDSDLPETLYRYSHLLAFTGRISEALPMAQRARELDPLNLRMNALEGQFLFYAGRIDDSLDRLQKTIEFEPNFWLAHLFAARAYIGKKMYQEAVNEAIKAEQLSGGNSEAVALRIYALAKFGKREEAQVALNELKNRANTRYVPSYCLALSYNALGDTNHAIALLEKGFEQRDVRMTFLKVEPKWDNLRHEQRFADLMKKMNLQ
jgi:tetratricopeptide (TPR) repeat protein